MAEKSGSDETPVELREEINRSRELVVRDMGGLRYELNFPLKFRKAFQRHTVAWVGAALAAGLLLALLRARTQKVYVNAGGKKVRSPNKTLLESGALIGLLETRHDSRAADGAQLFRKKRREERRRKSAPSASLVGEFPFTPRKRLPILWGRPLLHARQNLHCRRARRGARRSIPDGRPTGRRLRYSSRRQRAAYLAALTESSSRSGRMRRS